MATAPPSSRSGSRSDPKTFPAHLKHKAGLPKDWSPELRLSVYQVEKWKEGRGHLLWLRVR
jgi:hypothetical protein